MSDAIRDEFMCVVDMIEYDFANHTGIVWIANGGCTDMGGCVAWFTKIDAFAALIRTISDAPEQTDYVRNSATGRWTAVSYPRDKNLDRVLRKGSA